MLIPRLWKQTVGTIQYLELNSHGDIARPVCIWAGLNSLQAELTMAQPMK